MYEFNFLHSPHKLLAEAKSKNAQQFTHYKKYQTEIHLDLMNYAFDSYNIYKLKYWKEKVNKVPEIHNTKIIV